jgi:hypothetical protein
VAGPRPVQTPASASMNELSPGSSHLFGTLKSPMRIDLYASHGPAALNAFVRELVRLLRGYERAGAGRLQLAIVEPNTPSLVPTLDVPSPGRRRHIDGTLKWQRLCSDLSLQLKVARVLLGWHRRRLERGGRHNGTDWHRCATSDSTPSDRHARSVGSDRSGLRRRCARRLRPRLRGSGRCWGWWGR